MRPLKFRAWDKERQRYWSPEEMAKDQLTLMPDGTGFINVSSVDTRLSEKMPHLIPEQFTGLKDKNGKEAAKNDVIKVKDGDWEAKGVVVWNDKKGQWYWKATEIDELALNIYIGQEMPLWIILDNQSRYRGEIIGTAHANPELLEQE